MAIDDMFRGCFANSFPAENAEGFAENADFLIVNFEKHAFCNDKPNNCMRTLQTIRYKIHPNFNLERSSDVCPKTSEWFRRTLLAPQRFHRIAPGGAQAL